MAEMNNVKVAIRVRPFISREEGQEQFWQVKEKVKICEIDPVTLKSVSKSYYFDRVFDSHETTNDVYSEIGLPIVQSAMDGYHGTIFAYGQTSSGKTYTMQGTERNPGVIRRAIRDIFDSIEKTPDREFLLRVSYSELYNEELKDLLSSEKKSLTIREDGKRVFVQNLTEELVNGYSQVMDLLRKGEGRRHIAGTNMNEHSSRSHTIFCIVIESREYDESNESNDTAVKVAHLNLVDLAGSERANETGAEGTRLQEACKINQSLFCLGQVINKLSSGSSHIPYRESKLTRMLQSSLGGNAKTAIICTVTPATVNLTHSTLQFASSAKTVMNNAKMNEVLSDEAMLKKYKTEIKGLKERIQQLEEGNASVLGPETQLQFAELLAFKEKQEEQIEKLKKLFIVSSVASTPKKIKTKSNRRETWCPGTRKPFFPPPRLGAASLGLSPIGECSSDEQTVMSVFRKHNLSVRGDETEASFSGTIEFSPACDNSVFLNDLDEKAQQLDSSLPVKFEEMPPPPPPPPQSSVTSQRRKRRNLVHFADAPMKLLEEHTQDKGSQTDTVEDVVIETNIDANDELQQQLSELSSVSESLTAENIDLQNQLFNAENRVEELVLVKSQLEEEASLQQQQSAEKLEEILIENTRLREEIISKEAGEQGGSTHLEQTLADLEMLLRAREVEISMLKEMVSAAEDEKDNLRERHSASVSELNQRIEELQNQPRNELLVSTSNENDEVHLLKQKNEEFKKELEEALGLCERVVMEKTTLEQDFENAKDDRDRLHGDYLMLQGQYEALHTELEKKESELKDLEEFTRLEKDVEEQEIAEVKEKHQLDISHFKTNLESQTEKINELSEQVTHYKRISCEIAGDANIVQTVESLRKSCSDAEQVAMDTNKKLSQKVTESEALKEKLEKLQKQVKQLETEKSDFEFHIEMQQKRHNSLSKQLREDLQCTFSEISQLKGEEVVSVDQLSSSGKEKIEQLETEVKRHSETIGELEAERQNLSLKLTEIETHREALTKDLQAMEKEKGEAEEQCLILKAERESLNAKIEELLKTTSELEVLKDLHAMEKEKDEAEEQCLILKAEKESLNAKIEELLKATSNLEALTKDLQAMEKEKAEAEEQCLILRAEKDSLNSKIEELLKATSNLEALSKDLQAMEKEKAEAEEQCLILRAEKENLNAKIEELLKATSNLEALTKDLQAMEKEKAEVVEQCLILKAEKESLNAKIEERLEATSNLEVLRKDLQAIKKEKDEVVEQCLILKAEKESLNAKIEERLEATSNLEALKKDLQAMEKEKDEVVEQCLILKAEKESLNSKIEEHLKTTSKLEALRDSIVSDLEAEQNWHVESNQKCMVLESEKENLLLKMKSLEDRLLSLNAENNIDEQSQEIEVLKSKILELENERDILSNQVGDLITEKETLTSSMVELGEIQKSENMEESQTLMMEKAEMIDKLKNLVNEKDDLSSQVEELNIEKENLVAMLSDFQKSSSELLVSKLQVVCSERDALVEKVQCLERAQKTAQSEIEQLNTERLEMIIKIQELEILQSSDNTELDSKYSALLQSLAEVKEALRDARSEKAALETEKEDLSTKLRMLQSEKENLMDQLMTVKEELASLTEERDELKSDLNDNINEAIVVQDDLLQHQDMLEESKNKIKELKEAQQDMVSEMEFMVQQQQTLQSDLEEELSKNLKMCEQVMMFEVNEKSLKDEINSYKQQMDEATVELEKLTNKQIESEDASLKVSEENVILQEKLCTLETKLSLAVESVQDTTGSSEECQRLNDQVQRLLVDLHKMEELEELTRKEADILQKEVEELRAELTLSNKQNVQLEENGTESSEECQRLNDQVQRLLVDLRQMEELKELTRKEADILLKEMEELKAELTLTNKQNVLLEENLRAAKDISDSLSGLQEEVDELRQKNEFLEKVKTASFNETSGLQVKLVELERQLQLERAVNEDINGQVGNSQEIIAEFERKLQEECMRHQQTMMKLENDQRINEETKNQCNTLQSMLDNEQKKLAEMSELSQQLEIEITSLKEKLIKSEETIKDLSHQNSELILDNKYDRDESEKLVTSMAEENYKLEDQIKEGKLKQKTLYKQLMETEKKLAVVEESLSKKCQEVEQLKVQDVEKADKKLTDLSELSEQLKMEVTSLNEKLIKSEETIKDLSHQNSELILDNKYDRDESEKLVTSMAEENYKLEDQIKEGKLKQKTLYKQLMETKEKLAAVEESLFKKCQEVEQVKVHDVERADTNLSEVNEQLKIEVTSLKEKLIKSEETIKDLSHQNSELILDNKYDRDESEKLVTSMAEENYKLEDQIKEGKLKQKTLFKQLMEEKAKITNMESKVVTLEEELRKKSEQLSACDNSIQTIQLLKQENSDKNTEIRKLQRDLLMTTDPLEEEIKYQKSQVVYHKQLADQFKRSLNKLQQKTSVTSDTVAEPTNEKVGLYRGSGIVETCVVTSVLKAQKAQLERDLERSKAKNVLLENKITEQTSLFFAETLQRKQIEDEAKRWKSKARVLYDKLQAKGKADETDSETEVTHKALQEAKADGIRVNSPVKSAPNIEKIPIKATQPVGSAHNGGQLNQENGVPRFTKFTEPKEDKAQCKQQ